MLKLPAFYGIFSRLSKKEKLILNIAVFLISLVIFDRLLISPTFSKIRSLNEEITQEKAKIRKNLHILAQKDTITAESNKFNSFFETAKPEDEEMTSILKEVEQVANKNSVYLIDLKPGGLKGSGPAKKYLINLTLEAQMEQIVDFMFDIESSNRLLAVEKYQLEPKSRESSVARCAMVISKTFVP